MVLSEFKLRVPCVLLALIADRLLADRSVDAHGRNEQSLSPDAFPLPAPPLQEVRKAPLTLGARDTFTVCITRDTDYLGGTLCK